jgi:hypothetical protein
LGHKLYKDYVEKILNIPDSGTILSLFPIKWNASGSNKGEWNEEN